MRSHVSQELPWQLNTAAFALYIRFLVFPSGHFTFAPVYIFTSTLSFTPTLFITSTFFIVQNKVRYPFKRKNRDESLQRKDNTFIVSLFVGNCAPLGRMESTRFQLRYVAYLCCVYEITIYKPYIYQLIRYI